jgi:uncharacterized integral membrane protein
MRFLKALWLIVFFFLSLLFFIQNNEALGQKLTLSFDTYYFQYVWTNTAVPLYVVVLLGFFAGALVTLGYLIMDRIRLRMELAGCRRDNRKKEKELKHLRAIPLETAPLLESGDGQPKDGNQSAG